MNNLTYIDKESETDVKFGEWIRNHRMAMGLSERDAARALEIPIERLCELESGKARKGVNTTEAVSLAVTYKLDYQDIVRRACGNA